MCYEFTEGKRPVKVYIVGDQNLFPVEALVQQGLSGAYFARTKAPHPCPGNEPVHVWGSGLSEHAAVHEVAASIETLNRMGCIADGSQINWRMYL